MKFYLKNHQTKSILKSLDVYAILVFALTDLINWNLSHLAIFSLAIVPIKKIISALTLNQIIFLYPDMSFLMSHSFYIVM